MEPSPEDIDFCDGEHQLVRIIRGGPSPRPAQESPSEATPEETPAEETPAEETPLPEILHVLFPSQPSPPLTYNAPGQQKQPPNILDRCKLDRSWNPRRHNVAQYSKVRGLSPEEIARLPGGQSHDTDGGNGSDEDGVTDYFHLEYHNDGTAELVSSNNDDADPPGIAELNLLRIARGINEAALIVDWAMELATRSIHHLIMEMYNMEMRKRARMEMGWEKVDKNETATEDVDMIDADDDVDNESREEKSQRLAYAELSRNAMIRATSQLCSTPFTCTGGQPRSADEDIAKIEDIMPLQTCVLEILLGNVYAHMRLAGRLAAEAYTVHEIAMGRGEALADEDDNLQSVLETDHNIRKLQNAIDRGDVQAQAAAEDETAVMVEVDNGRELVVSNFEYSQNNNVYRPSLPVDPRKYPGFWTNGDFDKPDYYMNKGYPCGVNHTTGHITTEAVRAKKTVRLVAIPEVEAFLTKLWEKESEKRHQYRVSISNTDLMYQVNYMTAENMYSRFVDVADEMYLAALNIEKLLQAAVLLFKDFKLRGAHWGNNNPLVPQIVDEINAVAHKVRLSNAFCEVERAIMEIELVCRDLRDPYTLEKKMDVRPVGILFTGLEPAQDQTMKD